MNEKEDPRVQVARDVLAQLETKRLLPRNRVYLHVSNHGFSWPEGGDIKKILQGRTCTVCALGALFVARVDQVNGIHTAEMWIPGESTVMRKYLSDIFSQEQLQLIELAFEGPDFVDEYIEHLEDEGIPRPETKVIERAALFRFSVGGDAEYPAEMAMKSIMLNIIQNGGEFVPPPVANVTPAMIMRFSDSFWREDGTLSE